MHGKVTQRRPYIIEYQSQNLLNRYRERLRKMTIYGTLNMSEIVFNDNALNFINSFFSKNISVRKYFIFSAENLLKTKKAACNFVKRLS